MVALPLLMVGSLMFWGMAISLGGLSLMRAMTLASPPEGFVESTAEVPDLYDGPSGTIMVHLEESAEPQDLRDVQDGHDGQDAKQDVKDSQPAARNTGGGGVIAPDDQAVVVSGPGATSY
jgi:hypothetical protein